MHRIVLKDGFSVDDVIQHVQELGKNEYGERLIVLWDISSLTAVPWGQLIPLSAALSRERIQLESTVSESFVLLPKKEWRMPLNMLLRLYTPVNAVTILVAGYANQDPELAQELQLV